MDRATGLLIKRLILIGHRKNYIIPFHPGVNIIYGDAVTGKSSILRIIHYLLGGKQIKIDHELAVSVKYACLELIIGGAPYCIQRDLHEPLRSVDVYSGAFEDIEKSFPKKYAPSLSQSEEGYKSISEFVLEALNFPAVKLKQAPSKDSSATARLSILDLFKYLYLDQDDVGSAHMMNIGNAVLEVKNREVLKYIFNVLDSNISDLDSQISEKTTEKNSLHSEYKIISKFLSEISFESSEEIDREIVDIEEEYESLNKNLLDLNSRMVGDSELYEGLKDALNTISLEIIKNEHEKNESLQSIERFSRLKNDYIKDVDKLESSIKAKQVIGRVDATNFSCPICDSDVSLYSVAEEFSISDDDRVRQEITSISRRSKDLEQLIQTNREKATEFDKNLNDLYVEREKARAFLDEEMAKSVSPYIAERDIIVTEIARLKERREKYRNALKIRNQQSIIADQMGILEANIIKLKEKLEELKKNSPSVDSVIVRLGSFLDEYLEKINIKNRYGVSISKNSFLPIVRGVEYRQINSGGLRTIVSIGYLASILRCLLVHEINHPGLLMIDTVGKFLGKTKDLDGFSGNEDVEEGMSDPEKYKNIYEYFLDLAEVFEEKGKNCQIILVDNDIPPEIANLLKGFAVAHFSSNGLNDLPIGLIDDWDKFSNS